MPLVHLAEPKAVVTVPSSAGFIVSGQKGTILSITWKIGVGTISLYDGFDDTGTLLGTLDAANPSQGELVNTPFNTGLFVKMTGTVVYYISLA